MIWFTADTHFGHTNILKYMARPWPDIAAMDAALIERWNKAVKPHDDVWHLGDFAFAQRSTVERYVRSLRGRIHLVLGNHDNLKVAQGLFASVQEVKYLRFEGHRFWLSHYAHRVWRNSVHGSFHLYGHSHGDLPNRGRSMDVGVDAVGYRLISLEEVVTRLGGAPLTNHHAERPVKT